MNEKPNDWPYGKTPGLNKSGTLAPEAVRTFETGATRDTDETKLDFEGFFSPLVLERYAAYMHKNRRLKDGSLRASDNWQNGIPHSSYMKSMWRHLFTVWKHHRDVPSPLDEDREDALCGVIFNAMGMLHECVKGRLQ